MYAIRSYYDRIVVLDHLERFAEIVEVPDDAVVDGLFEKVIVGKVDHIECDDEEIV